MAHARLAPREKWLTVMKPKGECMFSVKKLGLAAIVSLSACSALNPEIGYLPLKDATKASVDGWLIDGQTTKDQINAKLGYYRDDYTPAMTENMRCKPADKSCTYSVYVSHAFFKAVTVSFDQNNVAKTHTFTEKPVD